MSYELWIMDCFGLRPRNDVQKMCSVIASEAKQSITHNS